MSDSWKIKSRFRDYSLNFIDDFSKILEQQIESPFFIIDRRVFDLYQERISPLLKADRFIFIAATEHNKTINFCESLIQALIRKNIKKNDCLVALGGGIVQDVTAFIASILFRGIEWSFCPTTLLAQADSCIGSKSSINVGEYKNQVGTFYPPSGIFIDWCFLDTLPVSEIKSGIGEILHYLLIAGDVQRGDRLSEFYEQFLNTPKLLEDHIRTSLQIKKQVIEIDELDKNERNLFNYGHTFGHAIEAISDFTIPHGQAVTIGMDIANFISYQLGYMELKIFESMHKILEKNMPRFEFTEKMIPKYLELLSRDKKNITDHLGCILSYGPGAMKKVQIPLDEKLKDLILSYFKIRGKIVCP